MGIVKTAVTKFRTTLLVMIFLIIMGTFGRAAMPIASNPNIQFPFVNISVFLEGASPEDMARIVAKPLENRFLRLEGQEQVRSTNTQSFTNLTIQYDVDYDIDQALLDVERAIGEVRNQLPPEANDPVVRERSDNDFPILVYSLYGFSNLRSGYAIAQEIQEELPFLVSTNGNGHLAVKYQSLIPLLVEAVKQLSQRVKDLEEKDAA